MIIFWLMFAFALIVAALSCYGSVISVTKNNIESMFPMHIGPISDLTDVHLNSVTNGDILVYSSSNTKWVNKSLIPSVELSCLGGDGDRVTFNLLTNTWFNIFSVTLPTFNLGYDSNNWDINQNSLRWKGTKTSTFELFYSISATTVAPGDNFNVAIGINDITPLPGTIMSYDFASLNAQTSITGCKLITLNFNDIVTILIRNIVYPPSKPNRDSTLLGATMILRATSPV